MYHHKIYSAFITVVQYEVWIQSTSKKKGAHYWQIKGIVYNFEYAQQDRVYNKQKKLA